MYSENEQAPKFSPGLLRETAEIALTEIKRVIEQKLTSDMNLRRVSAPVYLPADSGLNGPGPAVSFEVAGSRHRMEIVTGLDHWLRRQIERYDIAPGFGVYTVMNALRPEIEETATTSPHIAAWAWQQACDTDKPLDTTKVLKKHAARVYEILLQTQKMLGEKFPHMPPTLPENLITTEMTDIREQFRGLDDAKAEYEFIKERHRSAYLVLNPDDNANGNVISGRIMVWNDVARCPLEMADFAIFAPASDAPVTTAGGNIWRDRVAMQLFHRANILNP